MSNFQHKLFLIDGHALVYRVFFGLPIEQFTTKAGEPTNATFGFTRQIFDVIFAPEPPAYFAVSFDVGKTFILAEICTSKLNLLQTTLTEWVISCFRVQAVNA